MAIIYYNKYNNIILIFSSKTIINSVPLKGKKMI